MWWYVAFPHCRPPRGTCLGGNGRARHRLPEHLSRPVAVSGDKCLRHYHLPTLIATKDPTLTQGCEARLFSGASQTKARFSVLPCDGVLDLQPRRDGVVYTTAGDVSAPRGGDVVLSHGAPPPPIFYSAVDFGRSPTELTATSKRPMRSSSAKPGEKAVDTRHAYAASVNDRAYWLPSVNAASPITAPAHWTRKGHGA